MAPALGLHELRGVVGQPETVEGVPVEGQHDDGTSRHAPQIPQAGPHVRPLVDGECGHGGVEGLVVEGQVFGHAVQGRDGTAWRWARMAAEGSRATT